MNELFALFESVNQAQSYPPYNISVVGDNHTTLIEVAVSGFRKDELSLVKEGNRLVLTGKKSEQFRQERKKLSVKHNGLAFRDFVHEWKLIHDADITSVTLENGVLSIVLVIPERMKPQKFEIN